MNTENDLSLSNALDMAIAALNEQAQQYHFDARAMETFGNKAPRDVKKRAAKREKILRAIDHLKMLKYNRES